MTGFHEAIARGLAEELNRHNIRIDAIIQIDYWNIRCTHCGWCYSYITLYDDHVELSVYSMEVTIAKSELRYEDPQLFEQLLATLHKVEELSREDTYE